MNGTDYEIVETIFEMNKPADFLMNENGDSVSIKDSMAELEAMRHEEFEKTIKEVDSASLGGNALDETT